MSRAFFSYACKISRLPPGWQYQHAQRYICKGVKVGWIEGCSIIPALMVKQWITGASTKMQEKTCEA